MVHSLGSHTVLGNRAEYSGPGGIALRRAVVTFFFLTWHLGLSNAEKMKRASERRILFGVVMYGSLY